MNLKQIFSPRNVQAYLIIVVVFGLLADSNKAQSNIAIIGYWAFKFIGILAIMALPPIARHDLLSPDARTKEWRSYLFETSTIIIVTTMRIVVPILGQE